MSDSVDGNRKWLASMRPGFGYLSENKKKWTHSHPDVWGRFRGNDNVLYSIGGWQQYRYGKPVFRLRVSPLPDNQQVEWDGREHEWEDVPDDRGRRDD